MARRAADRPSGCPPLSASHAPAVRRAWLAPFLLVATLAAQDKPLSDEEKAKKEAWRVDPYTKDDPTLLEKLGYASYAPFAWTDTHGTADIEKTIGGSKVLFVETKHFKLGVSLPPYAMPQEKEPRAKLVRELERLGKILPKVKPDAKQLDPWLRLHLFAMRLEDLYAEFQKRAGVTDETLPLFGQKAKFTVLLLDKASSLGRYLVRYLDVRQEVPQRFNFIKAGSLFFGTCTEFSEGQLRNDSALHCHLVFQTIHTFVTGYRGYWYATPLWFSEGLAHWFNRNIDPKFNNYSLLRDTEASIAKDHDWKKRVRARVGFDDFTRAEKFLPWFQPEDMTFQDHMMLWSRFDWLMTLGDTKLGTFLDAIKGKQDELGNPPTKEQVLQFQLEGLKKAWDLDPRGFDEQWKRWVLATYPAK